MDDITVARGRQHGYPTAATEPTAGAPDADRHGSSPAGPHQELSGKFIHSIDSSFLFNQNKKYNYSTVISILVKTEKSSAKICLNFEFCLRVGHSQNF